MTVFRDSKNGDIESLRFRDSSRIVPLSDIAMDWPGIYYFSPDVRWLLRIQKTGSGDNQAMLYRIESDKRITRILGFDQQLWEASNHVARLKKKDLYHTGVDDAPVWSGDQLTLVLGGSNSSVSGDGISVKVTCDLKKTTFTAKQLEETK